MHFLLHRLAYESQNNRESQNGTCDHLCASPVSLAGDQCDGTHRDLSFVATMRALIFKFDDDDDGHHYTNVMSGSIQVSIATRAKRDDAVKCRASPGHATGI